jgi:hypothetical protein
MLVIFGVLSLVLRKNWSSSGSTSYYWSTKLQHSNIFGVPVHHSQNFGVHIINLGNWIADPCYLKEQPPIILGHHDDQLLTSEAGPNLVNWSDPPNGGRWYNFDPHPGLVDLIWLKCHRQGFFVQTITQPFIHTIETHKLYDKKAKKSIKNISCNIKIQINPPCSML